MLKRLFKYDSLSILRQNAPLYIASVIVSAICCGLLYFDMCMSDVEGVFSAFGIVMGFYVIGVFAMVAMLVVSFFSVLMRYYKSLFTDEGYLTMVIPVKTGTLLISKILVTLVFFAISSVLLAVCFFAAVLLPSILYDPEYIQTLIDTSVIITGENLLRISTEAVFGIIEAIAVSLENVLILLCAITLGSVTFTKRKLLGAILFYFIINYAYGFLGGAVDIIIYFIESTPSLGAYIASSLIRTSLALGVAVLMYFVNYKILKDKFNIA